MSVHRAARSYALLGALLMAAVSQLPGQSNPDRSVPDTAVIARVGPLAIRAREFRDSYEFGPSFVKRATDPRLCHLQYLINEKLIALDGYAHRVDTARAAVSMVREIEDDALVTAWYRRTIVPKVAIDSAAVARGVEQSAIKVTFRYIFSENGNRMREIKRRLDQGWSFDTLCVQCKLDPEFLTDEVPTTYFTLSQDNAPVAEAVARLKPGACSNVIRGGRGFFLVQLKTVQKDVIMTSSRYVTTRKDVMEDYAKRRLDNLTVTALRRVLERCPPTISGEALRAVFQLFSSKPGEAQSMIRRAIGLDAPARAELTKPEDPGNEVLITSACDRFTVQQFLAWYAYRDAGVDFSRPTRATLRQVKDLLFKMVRDKRVIRAAREKGFADDPDVRDEVQQWKDKLTYWRHRAHVLTQRAPTEEEVSQFLAEYRYRYDKDARGRPASREQARERARDELLQTQVSSRMSSYVSTLKSRYPVSINEGLLGLLHVSDEHLSKKIDLVVLKKEGTLQRRAFPTIDDEWQALGGCR